MVDKKNVLDQFSEGTTLPNMKIRIEYTGKQPCFNENEENKKNISKNT